MKGRNIFTVLLLVMILLTASSVPVYADIPEVSSSFYAADYADVIDAETEEYIVAENGAIEANCDGAQIVVVTVDFLDGMDIEDYCYKLFNDWQIGGVSNNGVLLLLTIGEENYWCMTGKGLENKLTAGDIDNILWYNLEDYFAAGDYDQGVKVTFNKLAEKLYDIYAVSGTDAAVGSENSFLSSFARLVVTLIIIYLVVTIVIAILGNSRKNRRRQTYAPARPVIITPRPARKVYIPTPHHRPYRPTNRPSAGPTIFGGGFGSSPSRPSSGRSFTSPGRSSFGSTRSSSSFGGGSRSRGIGRGGGGMSRGGGAGRRGR